jgi:hypothetical protein
VVPFCPTRGSGISPILAKKISVVFVDAATSRAEILMEERSPEKAGVGGSTPSLATIFSITYNKPDHACGASRGTIS